ncbi:MULTISPECIES: coniferyl aldehyde dehydrogenase [unclassified Pseudomonas]|uniref:coniferyl aldehyde dehydrogenase n=1 Tax=unclassified Pseudomonas TaxID=196821 RepID=UPI000876838A|nr:MULTISPECIES: coniferyl aldehyde dehydrogenase [unclassified Pseudomonas]MDB6442582.1 coniferyl aldehyde dehydrogenase [Pseudomonas sp. 21TX0197]ROO40389.1 aldehyde dehydrogenase [Pseudomonas sp. 7SR1]SCX65924.1 coniferyl-aldehyde dehydrogenase [Pseudomonas sp. NFACC32-1]SFX64882.1 coniferyl-aldehyde dehydrogenase [Pseudomonas sp. NFACC47-1]SFY01392.1 coniferyl-aldehyde dehydrogenase [Pseudomonas sp. NFACC36]
MSITSQSATTSCAEQLSAALARMKQAHLDEGPASLELRRDRLDRAIALLLDNREAIVAAVSADFGNRSREQTLLSDIAGSVASLKHCREYLAQWMQPQSHPAPFPGCQARVEYQPLGVVGVISPWNFPIVLAFGPLASIFAAGNRAMLKPSELTPRTSALIGELVGRYFHENELSTVLGDAEVGALFSAQPFDHLIFTGGTSVARHIMRAASENLVPVTLELGGKSPVLVSRSADLAMAVQRVLTVKTFNAGQICLAPDYVLLPQEWLEDFVEEALRFVATLYPTLRDNPDYTSIINPRNFDRLHGYLADARAKGARLIEMNPAQEDLADREIRKIAPTLVLDPSEHMQVLHDEIFGPLLPIKTYRDFASAIDYVNSRPRPLAAYYFGEDADERQQVLKRTTSGAVVINDVMSHVLFEALPFGGVGHSGMGAYHGVYGFRTFSHAKAVVVQSPIGESNLAMRAPYGAMIHGLLDQLLTAE